MSITLPTGGTFVISDVDEISSVSELYRGGADIYLTDAEGTEFNLEIEEPLALTLRNHLLHLYPLASFPTDEEAETVVESIGENS